MNIKLEISRQWQWIKPITIFLLIPTFLILLLVLYFKLEYDIDTGFLTRDSNAVAHQPIYIGFVSNLGILFWCASAAIALFTSSLEKNKASISVESFLLYSGILSYILLLDDLFQLHEEVFPNNFNIPEIAVLAVYGSFALLVFYRFRKIIPSTNFLILLICSGFFGISILVDVFHPDFPGESLVEDGAKFAGVVTWFRYYTSVSFDNLKKKLTSK